MCQTPQYGGHSPDRAPWIRDRFGARDLELGVWDLGFGISHVGRPTCRRSADASHLVLAELFGIEALEPLLEAVPVGSLGGEGHRLPGVGDRLLDPGRPALTAGQPA